MKNVTWARIIIVAFNSGDILQKCLDHLAKTNTDDYEVVIVDNNSSDGCVSNITLPNSKFKIIYSKINIGFAAASNLGAEGAKTEWIFTLNPDAFVTENWLTECKLAIKKFPNSGMISPLLLDSKDHNVIDGCGDVLSIFGHSWRGGNKQPLTNAPRTYCQVFSPSGACAGYRSDAFFKAGGFDASFFCYKEDVELGLRLNRMGEFCIYVPDAVIYHIGSSTLGHRHPFILYHSYRNSIFMIAKSYPLLNLVIALPVFTLSVTWIILRKLYSKDNLHIFRGLCMGLIATPFFLLMRLIISDRYKYKGFDDPYTKGSLYTPMNYSKHDLRNCNIWTKSLN